MAFKLFYNLDGTFNCVAEILPPGSPGQYFTFGPNDADLTKWNAYVAANGLPPMNATPAYQQVFNYLKTLAAAQQNQVLGGVVSWVLVNHPEVTDAINAAFTLNIPKP